MSENTERNLLAVSIKHTEYRWKFGIQAAGLRKAKDAAEYLRSEP